MTLAEAHYSFKLSFDRLSTAAKRDLNAAEIDRYLNDAQLLYIDRRIRSSTSSLAVPQELAPLIKRVDSPVTLDYDGSKFREWLSPLISDLRHLITAEAELDCGYKLLRWVDYEDLGMMLEDPFNRPSKDSFPYTQQSNGYRVYTPKEVDIKAVRVTYLMNPPRVNLGSYVYLDGIQHAQQNLMVHASAHPSVVQLAVALASLDLEGGQNQVNKLTLYLQS